MIYTNHYSQDSQDLVYDSFNQLIDNDLHLGLS